MLKHDAPHDATEISTLTVAFASSIFILVALASFWFAQSVLSNSAWQTVVLSLASVVLSVGLVGLTYELFVRRTVSNELMRLVGVERSVSAHKLRRVGDASKVDWPALLEPASRIRVLLTDPSNWVQGNWSSIVRGADHRPISIEFLFPDPGGPWLERIATFRDIPEDALAESIDRATRIIEDQWKAARAGGRLAVGSRVAVRFGDVFPTYAIIEADDSLIIIVLRSTKHPPADNGIAFQFVGQTNDFPLVWLRGQLDELGDTLPATYENHITTAGI